MSRMKSLTLSAALLATVLLVTACTGMPVQPQDGEEAAGDAGGGGLVITVGISKDAPMPTGLIELPVTSASATVGPFFASWDVSR